MKLIATIIATIATIATIIATNTTITASLLLQLNQAS